MSIIKCLNCDEDFKVPKCRDDKAKFCSTSCRYEHKKKIGRSLENRICFRCDKEFKVERRLLGKYCSEECYHLSMRNREDRVCLNCKKTFNVKKSINMNCCSIECRLEYQKTNKVDRSIYKSKVWKLKRYKVIARDNFKCNNCGSDEYELQVHHIVPVKLGGTDELENLITLCIKCHREVHSKIRIRS